MDVARTFASVIMWVAYLAMVWFSIEQLNGWAILMAFVLMIPLMGAMGIMWSLGGRSSKRKDKAMLREATSEEKRKRERLDAVLRDLSSEDLKRLKQRLADGQITDDILYDQIVGDDGELVDGY